MKSFSAMFTYIIDGYSTVTELYGDDTVFPDDVDGTGQAALFDSIEGVYLTGRTLYVSDNEANTIRKVDLAAGVVTTVVGVAYDSGPDDDSLDGPIAQERLYYNHGLTGVGQVLYVIDHHCIKKIDLVGGTVMTVAGRATSRAR